MPVGLFGEFRMKDNATYLLFYIMQISVEFDIRMMYVSAKLRFAKPLANHARSPALSLKPAKEGPRIRIQTFQVITAFLHDHRRQSQRANCLTEPRKTIRRHRDQ